MRLPLGRLLPPMNQHNRRHACPEKNQRGRLGNDQRRTGRLPHNRQRGAGGHFTSEETYKDGQNAPEYRYEEKSDRWQVPRHGTPPPYDSPPQARQRDLQIRGPLDSSNPP